MSTSEPIAVRADPPAVLDVPPAHLELRWRPLQLRDASPLHALLQAIEAADKPHDRHSYEDVLELLTGPWKDLEHDSLGGFDETGTLRAYSLVEIRPGDERVLRALLRGGVHPKWRGRGIGRAGLAWMEGRGRQKLAASGKDVPARLAVMVEEKVRDNRRLYAAAGFSPVRRYTSMRRDLRAKLPDVPAPAGVQLAPWDELGEQVRLAHNEAFADHWGSEPISQELWAQMESHRVAGWSFVAVEESGPRAEIAGYLLSARSTQGREALGYTYGYTTVVGVRRPWRGRGVGTALLVAAMAAYQAAGLDYACLRVDAGNSTGALGLYERLGYQATHGYVLYSVEI